MMHRLFLPVFGKPPALARQRRRIPAIAAFLACAILLLAVAPLGVHAQEFPSRPLRLIVPFPPGGSTDIFARLLGQKMAENLRQPVLVENRAGGGTLIAAEALIKALADGYTLMLSSLTTYSVNPALYDKLPYDPVRDFAPVSLTGRFPLVLVVGNDVPARSMRELIAWVKARPRELNFGSTGPTSGHRFAMELLAQRTGLEMTHIPYKGSSPALQDLLGGRIALMFIGVDSGMEMIRAGRVRALGIGSPERFSGLPEVPTIAEAGLAGFEASPWQGVVAPARTPTAIVARLNAEIARVLNDPPVRQKLTAAGIEPLKSSPEEFAAYMKSEALKWAEVIRQAKISVD